MLGDQVLVELPNLTPNNYIVTSPHTRRYNCIAWAAGCNTLWWWPSRWGYWPQGIPREETVFAFEAVFSSLGYESCPDGSLEVGYEKVALYVSADENGELKPTHAAKQLSDGRWTSKLGPSADIEHLSVEDVTCPRYGSPIRYLKRPTGH